MRGALPAQELWAVCCRLPESVQRPRPALAEILRKNRSWKWKSNFCHVKMENGKTDRFKGRFWTSKCRINVLCRAELRLSTGSLYLSRTCMRSALPNRTSTGPAPYASAELSMLWKTPPSWPCKHKSRSPQVNHQKRGRTCSCLTSAFLMLPASTLGPKRTL